MLSILIVQSQSMKGFYAVIVVSVLQIVATIVAMARFEDTFALNGLASTVLSLIIVGIIYFVLTFILSKGVAAMERRMRRGDIR